MIIHKPLKLILFFILICFVAGCRFSSSNKDIVNWLRQNCADQPVNCIALQNKDGEFGFVDYDNNELVPFAFDDASVFVNGRVSVKKNGLWGVINKSGEQLLDCTYQSPLQFSADLMYSYINGKKIWIDSRGQEVCLKTGGRALKSYSGQSFSFKENDTFGIIDTSGNVCAEPVYAEMHPFMENGYCWAMDRGEWVLLDQFGKQVSDHAFGDAGAATGLSGWYSVETAESGRCLYSVQGCLKCPEAQ